MKIVCCKDYQELSQKTAQHVINTINLNPRSCIGFATGSSPLGLYQELINAYKESKVSFKDIISFNLDEYVGINSKHEESYHFYMQENLFKSIDINSKNIHIPSTSEAVEETIKEYDLLLKKHSIDLQILGLGTNGHIGFNEPDTPFSNHTSLVKLDEQTRSDNARFFGSIDDVPTHAVTMGIKSIMKAKEIIIIVYGRSKKKALYNMINGEVTTNNPASILQLHNNVTIYTDNEAAALIDDCE